jgi:glycosyltransferase involved in cell wall biosynthesis
MKIYYDYQIFLHQKFGGISKYYINLINNLEQDIDKLIIAPFHKNYYLANQNENVKKLIFFDLKTRNITTISKNLNKVYTKFLYNYQTPDVFHFTYFNQKYYLKKKSSYVMTVYDLIKEKFYNDHYKNERLNKIKYFRHMDKIICISENTKKDLIEYYKIPNELIEVVHLGVSFDKSFIKIDSMLLKKPYILFVGDRSRYKNFKNFISAYVKSERLKKDFDIFCFGGGTFKAEEINFFKVSGISQNINQITGSDLELNYAYKNARCFVFPSLYEGFGLPLLESMNMDCPVICSNTSCFSEVTNNAAAMFDPNNVENLIHEIESLVYDDQKISDLIIKGRNNIKNFSWKKCADKTLEVYKSIV